MRSLARPQALASGRPFVLTSLAPGISTRFRRLGLPCSGTTSRANWTMPPPSLIALPKRSSEGEGYRRSTRPTLIPLGYREEKIGRPEWPGQARAVGSTAPSRYSDAIRAVAVRLRLTAADQSPRRSMLPFTGEKTGRAKVSWMCSFGLLRTSAKSCERMLDPSSFPSAILA